MKISTLKIIGSGILTLLLMAGGLVFAASFAVEELQSWPKALMEARGVIYGQIILGFSLGCASRQWHGRLGVIAVLAALASLFVLAWAMAAVPMDRFWVLFCGMTAYSLVGGIVFAELVRAMREFEPKTPPRTTRSDPSLS